MFANCTSDQRNWDITFFRVPVATDCKVAKQWYIRSKRADITFNDVRQGFYYVCDKHFLPSQLYKKEYGSGE
jgi:hypothetical protein